LVCAGSQRVLQQPGAREAVHVVVRGGTLYVLAPGLRGSPCRRVHSKPFSYRSAGAGAGGRGAGEWAASNGCGWGARRVLRLLMPLGADSAPALPHVAPAAASAKRGQLTLGSLLHRLCYLELWVPVLLKHLLRAHGAELLEALVQLGPVALADLAALHVAAVVKKKKRIGLRASSRRQCWQRAGQCWRCQGWDAWGQESGAAKGVRPATGAAWWAVWCG
jgi:hypothetical protein